MGGNTKRTQDINQVAFSVVKQTEKSSATPSAAALLANDEMRRTIMREMGSRGGKKGGVARAKSLTSEKRSEIASKAARKRWKAIRPPK